MRQPSQHDWFRRVSMLIVGPLYLLFLVAVICEAGGRSWVPSLLWVIFSAIVLMATFVAFGVRALQYREGGFRFGLNTVFLITIPVSIYLATIRWVVQGSAREMWRFDTIFMGAVISFVYVLLTTAVLIGLAESLMWCAVGMLYVVNKLVSRARGSSRYGDDK